jgi:hypothetical protein
MHTENVVSQHCEPAHVLSLPLPGSDGLSGAGFEAYLSARKAKIYEKTVAPIKGA